MLYKALVTNSVPMTISSISGGVKKKTLKLSVKISDILSLRATLGRCRQSDGIQMHIYEQSHTHRRIETLLTGHTEPSHCVKSPITY